MIEEYNFEEAKKKQFEEGIELGIQQGIRKEKQAVAKGMLSEGLSVETIAKLTLLSIEEIQSLI